MAAPERALIDAILVNQGENRRLFRINSGVGWQGNIRKIRSGILIGDPRPLHAGPAGWFDICGWESIIVTQDMVGKPLAIFCGIEVKTAQTRLTRQQSALGKLLQRMGGIWKVVKDKPNDNRLPFSSCPGNTTK